VASEEKLFQKLTNKKPELPILAMFVNGSKRNAQPTEPLVFFQISYMFDG
jgi:hypothetical protein